MYSSEKKQPGYPQQYSSSANPPAQELPPPYIERAYPNVTPYGSQGTTVTPLAGPPPNGQWGQYPAYVQAAGPNQQFMTVQYCEFGCGNPGCAGHCCSHGRRRRHGLISRLLDRGLGRRRCGYCYRLGRVECQCY